MKTKILLITALSLLTFPQISFGAQMALSPGGGELIAGCPTRINVVINTEGVNSRAADAFLSYNPEEIEVIDQLPQIGGIQLKPGSVYESYPGNQVNNGSIRLTAFNRIGFFNGRGNLASFVIKSKPNVEKTTIGFNFSPGRTTDSNIANEESKDVLSGAYGANFSFKKGSCGSDKTPPKILNITPDDSAMLIEDQPLTFEIKDLGSEIDLNQLEVQVNDDLFTKEGDLQFSAEGKGSNYKITINPTENFEPLKTVNVKIRAQDKNGNSVEKRILFNQFVPVEACQVDEPIEVEKFTCPEPTIIQTSPVHQIETLKPSAPESSFGFSRELLIFLLILLALSLLLNIELLYLQDPLMLKAKFTVNRIKRGRKTSRKTVKRKK